MSFGPDKKVDYWGDIRKPEPSTQRGKLIGLGIPNESDKFIHSLEKKYQLKNLILLCFVTMVWVEA